MKKILIVLLSLTLLGQACIPNIQVGGKDGGVFKSTDFGDNWNQKITLTDSGKTKSTIAGANILKILIDKQDSNKILIGTQSNGLLLSTDAGDTWTPILSNKTPIQAISTDPKNFETIYVGFGEKIIKTTNSGKNWDLMYSEPRRNSITELATDQFDSRKIYAGIDSGEIIKSHDSGTSWTLTGTFNSRVLKILINPKNSNTIYTATASQGVFRSYDAGNSWNSLRDRFETYTEALKFQDLTIDINQPGHLLHASNYGLLETNNAGETWTPIKLLTPPASVTIYSVALNPIHPNEIIYGTALNIFKTADYGKTWISLPLPTSRAAGELVLDHRNPQIVYLGTLSK